MTKYKYILPVALCIFNASFAQPIPPKSIEDSILGWMKVYNYKGTKTPLKVDNKSYSAAQLSISDSFVNWIQASYMPKGGLGDVKKEVSEKLGLYNKHTAAMPQSYGATAKTYMELKYNSNRKMELYTSGHIWWDLAANGVPGDWAVRDICTPTQFYFTLPTAETEVSDERVKPLLDLTKNKNIKPYISFWLKNMGFGGGTENVILCKDNKSPFIKITKGEFLQALEIGIPRFYEEEKRKIHQAEQGNQQRMAPALRSLDENKEKFITGVKNNRERYKNRLGELALISSQFYIHTLISGDIFSNGQLTDPESTAGRVPVYKIDPVMAELCKKDQPQWILFRWEYYPIGTGLVGKQLHEAITNNFNFDYVYNFFFAPEKVKGQRYKPLRSPVYKEAVVVAEASETAKKNATDKNIHFFEDFSTTAIGKRPAGWYSTLSFGTFCTITKLDGLEGNWAVMSNYILTSTQLKKPLPQDFTLTYELVAAQNFTWGAKGLTFLLAKETSPGNAESYLSLKLRPGFDGKDGEATLETKFPSPPGYSNTTKWFGAPGFSNNKKNNRITVTIKKTGETLQVFIDKNKIAEYQKAIPAAHLFNAMSFTSGNTGENDKFYISNIKITKE